MQRAIGFVAVVLTCACSGAPGVFAQSALPACDTSSLDVPIARASTRFALPEALIRAVIAVESAGQRFAVSPKGAMGLMQLMPGTWAELRVRFALGHDPFEPCDNVFAGTAYLRDMLDRYGDPGFLAAYNAGPGRYELYVRGVRPLPAETITYVASIAARTGRDPWPIVIPKTPDPDIWRRAELFARATESQGDSAGSDAANPTATMPKDAVARPPKGPRDMLFVPRTSARK